MILKFLLCGFDGRPITSVLKHLLTLHELCKNFHQLYRNSLDHSCQQHQSLFSMDNLSGFKTGFNACHRPK